MSDATKRKAKEQVLEAERMREALLMRRRGFTYETIAKHIGYVSRSSAYNLVQRGLKQITVEPAEELRKAEDERLQEVAEQLGAIIFRQNVDREDQLKAIDRYLRVHEKRAKLWGLEAPSRMAFTDSSGRDVWNEGETADAELDELIKTLRARNEQLSGGGNGDGRDDR